MSAKYDLTDHTGLPNPSRAPKLAYYGTLGVSTYTLAEALLAEGSFRIGTGITRTRLSDVEPKKRRRKHGRKSKSV